MTLQQLTRRAIALLVAAVRHATTFGRSLEATVGWICDGDTIVLSDQTKVRLLAIDAPELDQEPYGPIARSALARLIPPGTPITLRLGPNRIDKFNRTLAYVYNADGECVNAKMASLGYVTVEVYHGENTGPALHIRAAGAMARLHHEGFWSTGGFIVPPRHHRATKTATEAVRRRFPALTLI